MSWPRGAGKGREVGTWRAACRGPILCCRAVREDPRGRLLHSCVPSGHGSLLAELPGEAHALQCRHDFGLRYGCCMQSRPPGARAQTPWLPHSHRAQTPWLPHRHRAHTPWHTHPQGSQAPWLPHPQGSLPHSMQLLAQEQRPDRREYRPAGAAWVPRTLIPASLSGSATSPGWRPPPLGARRNEMSIVCGTSSSMSWHKHRRHANHDAHWHEECAPSSP